MAAAGDPKVYFNLGGSQEKRLLLNTNEKLAVFGLEQAGLFQIAKHNFLTLHRFNLSHRHPAC